MTGNNVGARFAAEIFRQCIVRLVSCRPACSDDDLNNLEKWEMFARFEKKLFKPLWTAQIVASQQAKSEAPKAENVRAHLLYKLSHTPVLGENEFSENHLCPACGGEIDYERRASILQLIESKQTLDSICRKKGADSFIGTHLRQEELFMLFGKEIKFERWENWILQRRDAILEGWK